ncbi:MAG: hypothetical protein R3264_12325, partial [Anaerolineae bacterium]|nr:hypothetical protein [Anaerolineae bacterium]
VSFWATFGWLNIVAPEWVYSIYRIISRIGLIGVGAAATVQLYRWLATRWTDQSSRIRNTQYAIRTIIIHLVFPVALAFSLTRLVALEGGLQGRQLLPALGSMAIVIVWGWWVLTPHSLVKPVMIAVVGVLLALAIWMPFGLIKPAYVPNPFLTEADLPPDLNRVDLIYGDVMKLIGVTIETETAKPGDRVPVTVYWQALDSMDTNYSVFVHLIGRDFENVGQLNTYPGLGLRPTTTLQPGQIFADTYPVLINGGSAAPARLAVNVGLFDFEAPGRPGIPPTTPAGDPASTTVGHVKMVPTEWPAVDETDPLAEFGDNIRLMAYRLDDCRATPANCRLTLTWRALGQPARDYTVFIQLWPDPPSATEPMFFGFDSPPLNNDYPTGLWAAGEVIIDPHPLDLSPVPPGTYHILTGLYNPTDGARLPASLQGEPLPNDAVRLETIEVPSAR